MQDNRVLVYNKTVRPEDAWCPRCGASEDNPKDPGTILIRGLKVFDEQGAWSQCLYCAGYYDAQLNVTKEKFVESRGWFCDPHGKSGGRSVVAVKKSSAATNG